MKSALDSQSIEIPCPHCGKKTGQTIARLKTNPHLTCPSCRGGIDVDATQMRTEIAKVEKSLAQLSRTLGRLGK